MVAACKAIEDGDFAQARHHLNNLSVDGTHPGDVEQLRRLILQKEAEATKLSVNRIGLAFAVAILGYAVLSYKSPDAWGQIVWGLLAFLVLPILAGGLAGTSVANGTKPAKFWRAFGITSISAALYTLVGLSIARARMHSSDKSMDFAIYLVVAVIYGVTAGLIGGVAGTSLPAARKGS